MPEEKKKESFTFSDKIKNSKQVASKSFGNRITSKIGSDGKPHQTLFERTKRDAPFFIAALVALLLLPFLYKYSGQVEDEPTMVTPSYDDAILNPDRSGFDFTGTDPEGQIAQLAGRDSMDLIVGFGKRHSNEEESADSLDEIYRNGLSDSSANSSYARNDMDEETNTTNIYKVRKKAPAQTRASVRRATTKINKLGGAGVARGSGGRVPFTWGGSLKNAANKVRSNGPVNRPKPVSLQPLQAAGKPSRSYFGNGAAAEARRSKDAMSKGNAMQALMDAQMKPVDPGRVGGITGGDFGGPGGGNGNLHREFNYHGEKPWWWDLMKTRSQMQWEARFKRGWKYIDALDDVLINIGKGLLNCLLTGDDGGDVGGFFGSSGSETAETCCGKKAKDIDPELLKKAGGSLQALCKNKSLRYKMMDDLKVSSCPQEYKPGKSASDTSLGFFGVRFGCLGVNVAKAKEKLRKDQGEFVGGDTCGNFAKTDVYEAKFESVKGKKWSQWYYIVGLEDVKQIDAYYKAPADTQLEMLKILYVGRGNKYTRNNESVQKITGVPFFIESVAVRDHWYNVGSKDGTGVEKKDAHGSMRDNEEKYWQLQKGMSYSKFRGKLIAGAGGMVVSGNGTDKDPEKYRNAEKNLEYGTGYVLGAQCEFPLARIDCDDYAIANIETSTGTIAVPYAHLSFYGDMKDPSVYDKMKTRFRVSYNVQGGDNEDAAAEGTDNGTGHGNYFKEPVYDVKPCKGTWKNATCESGSLGTERKKLSKDGSYQVMASKVNLSDYTVNKKRMVVTWQISQCDIATDGTGINTGHCSGGKVYADKKSLGQAFPGFVVSEATCTYYDGKDVVNRWISSTSCEPNAQDFLPAQKEEGKCQQVRVCGADGQWGEYNDVADDPDCIAKKQGKSGQKKRLHTNAEMTPSPVPFYGTIANIPVAKGSRSPVGRAGYDSDEETPAKRWQSCVMGLDGTPLLDMDPQTEQYVAESKKAFDEANADKNVTLSYDINKLTIAELVDAINMNPQNTVPANTACLLGKTIGANAADPTYPQYDNLFGAFLAFITYDAVARPAKLVYDENKAQGTDYRFHSERSYESGYSPVTIPGKTPLFSWAAYMENGEHAHYFKQIDNPQGPWHGLPLAGLAREPLAQSGTRFTSPAMKGYSIDESNRLRFQKEYDDLTRRMPCKYGENVTLKRDDVLEYVSRLCEFGVRMKPVSDKKVAKGYVGKRDPKGSKRGAATGTKTDKINYN